jgi:hypothetical protein
MGACYSKKEKKDSRPIEKCGTKYSGQLKYI